MRQKRGGAPPSTRPLYPATDVELRAEVRDLAQAIVAGSVEASNLMLARAQKYADYEERVRRVWKKSRPRQTGSRLARTSITDFTVGGWPFRT